MKNKFSIAMSLALIAAMLVNSLAFADNVQNDVVVGGNDTFTAGGSTTVNYRITANSGDGESGCNATVSSPATVTINVPGGVTVDTSGNPGNQVTLTFTACGTNLPATFSSSTPGNYSITVSVSDSGTGTYNVNPATFTLKVLAPIDSTPPVITKVVTGTLGNNSWYTTDVSVDWTVTDPQSSFTTSGCIDTTINSDTAGSLQSCSATSAGGTSSDSVTIKRDATAPSISGSASPAPNAAGWNNTDVDVTFSCSDGTSGVASCGPNQTLTSNGADQSATGNAVDNAGNTASATVTNIDIDQELPSITASVPTPNANNWYNDSVIATFECDDFYSGVASCEGPHTFSAEGSSSFTGNATDVADNANSTSVSVMIDTVDPVIALVSRTPANGNGWNNGDVDLEWSCTDGGSGVVEASAFASVTTEGANQSATGTCEDLAGNSASDTQTGINIDLTPPTASASALPAPNGVGWNNTNVTVSFSGSDALSDIDFCDAAVVLSGEGEDQSASGTCTDKAGNVSDLATASGINIDKTAPSVSASASPAPNANGWNNTNVTVSFSGTDSLSGMASCDANVVLSSEGADQSASGSCLDNAGNTASATASNIDIDKTAPTVALVGGPANGGTYYFGSVPAAPTCSASDALSGLDGACTVSGYGTGIGFHTVSASAKDLADNTAVSASSTYEVKAWTINGFYAPVDRGIHNIVKGGATVPLKFEVFAGPTELNDTSIVSVFTQRIGCTAGTGDDIEQYATGNTSLRYDTVSGQFIFNWKTLKSPGSCYRVTLTTLDGTSIFADFTLK